MNCKKIKNKQFKSVGTKETSASKLKIRAALLLFTASQGKYIHKEEINNDHMYTLDIFSNLFKLCTLNHVNYAKIYIDVIL